MLVKRAPGVYLCQQHASRSPDGIPSNFKCMGKNGVLSCSLSTATLKCTPDEHLYMHNTDFILHIILDVFENTLGIYILSELCWNFASLMRVNSVMLVELVNSTHSFLRLIRSCILLIFPVSGTPTAECRLPIHPIVVCRSPIKLAVTCHRHEELCSVCHRYY